MAPLTIHVGPQKLSDGSEVFNVYLGIEAKGEQVLPAYSEKDARELADSIAELIERHTCADVRVKRW